MADGNNTGKKKISPIIIALIIAVPAVIAATVAITILLMSRPPELTEPAKIEASGAPVLTIENYKEIQEEIQDKVEKGMFETYMTTTWNFPDGKSPSSNAVMGNAASNNYSFYFEVSLNDTKEVVFKSNLLPVGTEIEEIVLSQELPEGTYLATVFVHMIDDDGEPVESNMGFTVTIIIEN